MKITLVNTLEFDSIRKYLRGASNLKSTGYPPIGLMTLAAVLEAKGYEVEVIDFGNLIIGGQIDYDDNFASAAAQYINERRADIVGFSSRCDNYLHSLRMAEAFRKLDASTPIVFGGPQATITDTASMESFPFIDFVVRHEAEYSFPALLEALRNELSFGGIPGIVYRCEGSLRKNPDPPLILNLDEIPVPSFKHFPIETLDLMPIEVGRGCPFGCTFCVTNRYFNRRYRLKSADRIVDEVELMQQLYGFKEFNFIHDMLTASRNLVMQLCNRIIERGIDIEWSCSARTDCVDRVLLEAMHAAGCRNIYCGIETGSQRMQKVVNKNLKLDTVFPMMDICEELGMSVTASFIGGFPEEQQEDIEATLRMMSELSVKAGNLQLHLYCPTPGTPLNDKFGDRLIYTGYISDIGFSTSFNEADESWIKANPDIFTNYFQVQPLYLDLESISGLDAFGYCLPSFSHFFFYLVHEPDAPGLFEFWTGLKKWVDSTGLIWDIERYLAGELIDHLERYIAKSLAESADWPPVLAEAFNLDRALLHLNNAVDRLPGSRRERLRKFNARTPARNRVGRIGLRSPVILTEARCDLSEMMASVKNRAYAPVEISDTPTAIGIFIARERAKSKGSTFAFIEISELVEAILEATDKECAVEELPGLIAEALTNGNGASVTQKCLLQVERLMRLQAIMTVDDEDSAAQQTTESLLVRIAPTERLALDKPGPSGNTYKAEAPAHV